MAVVALAGVTKLFGTRRCPVVAVEDVTLEVDEGEIVVLLGPSGCGKTTTLRLVAGLEVPSGGKIEICGRDVRDVSPKDRDVAMVFQDYALYPHLNVFDNLAFGLRMRRTAKQEIRRRVAEVAELLGLAEILDRRPHTLSGGQQQRVAVGRAIVRRPNAYLLDEPLANLDAGSRLRVRAEFKRLQSSLGWTALYVTHDQHEAMALADRMVVMRCGRVQQIGRPDEVYDEPANRFVAGFVGTPSMNFFEGRLSVGEDDGVVFESDGWSVAVPSRLKSNGALRRDEVVLGVRPERVSLSENASDSAFRVQVTLVEPLGDRVNVYARDERGREVVAKLSRDESWSSGRQASVSLDLRGASFFEPGEDGLNLASVDAGPASAVSGG